MLRKLQSPQQIVDRSQFNNNNSINCIYKKLWSVDYRLWTKLIITFSIFIIPFISEAAFKEHLTWKSEVEKISETEYKVKFICSLEEDWHTYSQHTKEGGPLPTEFRFEKNNDIELIGKVEEVGKKHVKFDELFGVDVTSFDGDVTFVQKVKLKNPNAVLKGEFDGQVCKDEEGCMPFGPEKFSISFNGKTTSTTIIKKDDTIAKTNTTIPTSIDTSATPATSIQTNPNTNNKFDFSFSKNDCSVDAQQKQKGWLWIFIAGFLGGLFALLTPCVFPMIPLTVSFFTKGGKDQKSGLVKALLYGLSIIIIYVSLGLIITSVFGSDALNAMSTNIWFNLLFFVVFIIFAISFFGVFEITLPASWANKTDSLSSKGGYLGIFFMAFTLALVSFSCTGPIIGTLLVVGGSSLFIGLLGFGIALALPFTLFAMFPQWLKSLPKSGGWLTTVKVILGFIELALAFKFLSTVDMTMNYGILRFEPFMIIWILIFAIMAIYCFGFFKSKEKKEKEKKSNTILIIGFLTLLFTAYLSFALVRYKPIPLLSGIIPPTSYNFKEKNEEKFIHFKDYEEGLAYAKTHNMPILLDFTGFGCVNCRKIEDAVWTNKNVIEEMKKYVIISLYVDDRKPLPENEWYTSTATGKEKEVKTVGQKWSDFQAKHFQTNSQPQYILINTKEQLLNQPIAYDFASKTDNYISFLQCGIKMNEQLK